MMVKDYFVQRRNQGVRLIVCIIVIASFFNVHVAFSQESVGYTQSITNYFEALNRYPKENIYLHLDKPYYSAEDKMFYKGYLVDNNTLKNTCLSNYMYVELVNEHDSLIFRQKIQRDSLGIFKGSYKISSKIKKGNYYIRAYTNWMRNWPECYYYSRNIYIGNCISNNLSSTISYTKRDSTHYDVHFSLLKDNAQFKKCTVVAQFYCNGECKKQKVLKTDENGSIIFPLEYRSSRDNKVSISLKLDDPEYEYYDQYTVPVLDRDYSLSFFPEGGNLLVGTVNTIAFKAQADNGYSTSVNGFILDSKRDTVALISTVHDGMGRVPICPILGEEYEAVVTDLNGLTKRFPLPKAVPEGLSISLLQYKDRVLYQIKKTETTILPDSLNLIIHSSGKLLLNQPLSAEKLEGRIASDMLPEGIIHFLLVKSGQKIPVSERLLYNRHAKQFHLAWVDSTLSVDKRAHQKVSFRLEDSTKNAINGDFSVSVTDGNLLKYDSSSDNIYTSFFITSQLKGFIENPGYYFSGQGKDLVSNTDLLMLTHGWRKYTDFDFTKACNFQITYPYEVGQVLTGRVKNLWGKGPKGKDIIALSTEAGILAFTQTTENGKFVIDGISFPDSTAFVLQAKSKGLAKLELIGDTYRFPVFSNKNLFPTTESALSTDYLVNVRNDYFNSGGMQVYNLKEVTVVGKKAANDNMDFYLSSASVKVEGEELLKYGSLSAYDVVLQMPNVMIDDNKITVRGGSNVALIIDDVQMAMEESIVDYLHTILVEDVEYIAFLKGTEAAFYGGGADGVIAIKSKLGVMNPIKQPINVIVMHPMGYTVCEEFYNPVYDTPEKIAANNSDTRTTLYWSPQLKQENGVYHFDFYNNDRTRKFHIEIEGITEQGIPYYYSKEIE